jgi:hypothetical protein
MPGAMHQRWAVGKVKRTGPVRRTFRSPVGPGPNQYRILDHPLPADQFAPGRYTKSIQPSIKITKSTAMTR